MDKPIYLAPAEQNTLVNRLLAPFFPRYRVLLDLEREPAHLRGALLVHRFNRSTAARSPVTPAQRARIEALYAPDFEAFGYQSLGG